MISVLICTAQVRFTKRLVLSDDDNGDDECEFLEADERVVCVQYLAELDCVVVACASGTIATVNASTLQVRHCDSFRWRFLDAGIPIPAKPIYILQS